jgi:hypothetical protein
MLEAGTAGCIFLNACISMLTRAAAGGAAVIAGAAQKEVF